MITVVLFAAVMAMLGDELIRPADGAAPVARHDDAPDPSPAARSRGPPAERCDSPGRRPQCPVLSVRPAALEQCRSANPPSAGPHPTDA